MQRFSYLHGVVESVLEGLALKKNIVSSMLNANFDLSLFLDDLQHCLVCKCYYLICSFATPTSL